MLSNLEKQLIQVLYDENVELTYLEAELINGVVEKSDFVKTPKMGFIKFEWT